MQHSIVSTCNQYFRNGNISWFFSFYIPKSGMYFTLTAMFQVLHSHTWLLVTILDSTDLRDGRKEAVVATREPDLRVKHVGNKSECLAPVF